MGFVAVALALGACASAYKAGCTHTGAGASPESLDHQLMATWQAIPSLVLGAAVWAAVAGTASAARAAWRATVFLLIATPLAGGALISIESYADAACFAAKQHGG